MHAGLRTGSRGEPARIAAVLHKCTQTAVVRVQA